MTTSDLTQTAQAILAEPQAAPIRLICLFGSAALGKQGPFSDVDIGIYADQELDIMVLADIAGRFEEAARPKLGAGLEKAARADVAPGPRVDLVELAGLWNRKPVLAFEIARDLKPLAVRDPEAIVHFKKMAFLFYADTARLREQTQKAFLRRLETGRFGRRNYVG